jgi:hypothetical protein
MLVAVAEGGGFVAVAGGVMLVGVVEGCTVAGVPDTCGRTGVGGVGTVEMSLPQAARAKATRAKVMYRVRLLRLSILFLPASRVP